MKNFTKISMFFYTVSILILIFVLGCSDNEDLLEPDVKMAPTAFGWIRDRLDNKRKDKEDQKPDIVVNDELTIYQAIDIASNDSSIYIPPGNYTLTEPIIVDKSVHIYGAGVTTKLFQSKDKNLFDVTYNGSVIIEKLCLGSAATSVGKSLIKLNSTVVRSIIRDIWMKGGYYGIWLNGCLEVLLEYITTTQNHFGDCSRNQYWIYGNRAGGRSINGVTIFHPDLGAGGTRGIYITDNHAEGSISIIGGVVQGQPVKGIYLSGIQQCLGITGLHLESHGSNLELTGCKNVNIENIFACGNDGLIITKCSNVNVEGGYFPNGISVDEYSDNISISGVTFGEKSINSSCKSLTIKNIHDTTNSSFASSGMYMPNESSRNIVDGMLESWVSGFPIGFSEWRRGELSQERSIVKFGNYSAKITIQPGFDSGALTHELDVDRFARVYLHTRNSDDYKWTKYKNSDVYYCENKYGGSPGIEESPLALFMDGVLASENSGAYENLSKRQWCYGRGDLSFSTIFVRINDDMDPDSKIPGYIQSQHERLPLTVRAWAYRPNYNGFDPRISIYTSENSAAHSEVFDIPLSEWTPITATFYIPPHRDTIRIQFGAWNFANSGSICYFDGIEIVEGVAASSVYNDTMGMDSDFRVGGRLITSNISTFVDGDSTPSVSSGNIFKTSNTVNTVINNFDDGVLGQEIFVIFKDNNTIIDFTNTNLFSNYDNDWIPMIGDSMKCIYDGTFWYCIY